MKGKGKKGMLRKMFASVLVVCMIATPALADMTNYMSNFLNQLGNLEPKAYHMQQRGYFVGGTMHVPPMGTTIQPLSITLPSIKNNSCGGIDVTMGGFSYLNFDYLVQKLQGIIQAAPALAFQIAIKVLSEQLGDSADWLETVTNAINGLNFNSCTAMNGIVTTTANAINKAIKETGGEGTKRQNEGGGDFFGSIISDIGNNIWKAAKDYFQDKYKEFKKAIGNTEHAKEEAGSIDSLLASAANDLGGLPSDFVNMMRYYLGDVIAVKQNTGDSEPSYAYQILWPCGEDANANGFIKDIRNGVYREVTLTDLKATKCQTNSIESGNGLIDQVRKAMNDIYTHMPPGQGNIPQESVNLIEISPIPIYAFIRNATLMAQDYTPILIEQLAKPVASAIAAEYVAYYIRVLQSASSKVVARMRVSADQDKIKELNFYLRYLYDFSNRVSDLQYKYIKESADIYGDFMRRYENLQKKVDSELTQLGLKAALEFQKMHSF